MTAYNRKVPILIAIFVLITLTLATVFIISSTLNKKDVPETTSPQYEAPEDNIILSEEEKKALKEEVDVINTEVLSLEQAEKLDTFTAQLPYQTSDFEIGYSLLLGQFFVQKKSDEADTELEKYLQNNDFIDVYDEHPELFVETDLPVSQAIMQAEEETSSKQTEFQQQQ